MPVIRFLYGQGILYKLFGANLNLSLIDLKDCTNSKQFSLCFSRISLCISVSLYVFPLK